MTDNTQVNTGTGDIVRDIDRAGVKTQVVQLDAGGASAESLVSLANPLPIAQSATNFVFSANGQNSTITQLAPGATFTGTVESITVQQAISVLMVSDQPMKLVVNEFIDAAGTQLTNAWTYNTIARQPFSQAWNANGNYHQIILTNIGVAATTTLVLNTAYGTLPATTQLGNNATAITEVAGVNLPTGGSVPVTVTSSVPIATNDIPTAAAQSSDAPQFVTIAGDPNGDFAGVNILEKLVDDSGELSMAVKVVNPPKLDVRGATVLSDAPAPIYLVGAVGQNLYIDTSNYQSLVIQTGTLAGSITVSNDGVTFASALASYQVTGASSSPSSTISANAIYTIPVLAKFIRIAVTVAGSAVAYLRNIPAPNPAVIMPQNIAQIGGGSVVQSGLTGSLAVGGGVAAGVAPANSTNPLLMAGTDSGTPGVTISGTKGAAAIRTMLFDNTGRLRLAEEATTTNNQNVPSLAVQEVGQFEGQSRDELLAQILLEMRIGNQLMAELPNKIYIAVQSLQLTSSQQNQFTGFASDDPSAYRSDPTIFN